MRAFLVGAGRGRRPAGSSTILLAALLAIVIALPFAVNPDAAHADEGQGFIIEVSFPEGGSPIEIPVKVDGSRVGGTYSGPGTDPLGHPLYARVSFTGTISADRIVGKLVSHAEETGKDGSGSVFTRIYDGELDGVVLAIEDGHAGSDVYTMTNHYRDAGTGEGGSYPLQLRFTADLSPLIQGGYEFAAPDAVRDDEGEAVSGEKTARVPAGTDEDGAGDVLPGVLACLLAAAAAATSLLSSGWRTVAGFAKVFSRPSPAGSAVPPPPPPPPPAGKAPRPPEATPTGREAPPEQPRSGEASEKPAARKPPGEKKSQPPPREETPANHLKAWEEESKKYQRMFEDGQLGYDDFVKIRAWRLYDRVPMEEIEIRARLMVLTNKEYKEFYDYVVSKGVDNYADGLLWEKAARMYPVANTISKLKDLAGMPYDIVEGFYDYRDASAAQAVLKEYVDSYALKTPQEAERALRETMEAIKETNRAGQALERRLERGYRWEKGEAKPETPLDLEEAAGWNPDKLKQDIDALEEEARALEYRRKALDLRLKAMKGEWRQVMVRWEAR